MQESWPNNNIPTDPWGYSEIEEVHPVDWCICWALPACQAVKLGELRACFLAHLLPLVWWRLKPGMFVLQVLDWIPWLFVYYR